MKGLWASFKRLVADPLFARVCMFLWGIPFLALGGYTFAVFRPADPTEWVAFAVVLGLFCMGLVLVGTATLGSKQAIGKAADLMHDGGDIAGIIMVLLVVVLAIPLTILLRFITKGRHGEQSRRSPAP